MAGDDWNAWLSGLDWKPAVSAGEFKALPHREQLKRIRHSSSHVLATALRRIDPTTQFAIGPATEMEFFYDVQTAQPISDDQLERVEAEMSKTAAANEPFEVASVPKSRAIEFFTDLGQKFKLQILERIADDTVTFYRNGEFVDLCAGPHVPHTGFCKTSKLLNVSAVHWRQEDKPSLTRIAGTAWDNPKAMKAYLRYLEETKARDHRVLGPQLDLFSFHQWAAAALWHPKGLAIRNEMMNLWRELMEQYDYIEILNPLLYRKELFETSGHWDHFRENMFIFKDEENNPTFILKPMNCPDTMLYFKSQTRSYRELPLRVAESQVLHRNEPTGTLHGIMRTRSFVQDDAHIFLAAEHIRSEMIALIGLLDHLYGLFGLDYEVRLSTRPDKYMGDLKVWDEAEESLKAAIVEAGKEFGIDEGEGAFYGPKIDINIKDSLGRNWQCGTMQLDFQLPERFDLKYAADDGTQKRPIVIHRAIFGSIERFLGVLIEHFAGALPTWLSPVQVAVLPIGEGHAEYAEKLRKKLRSLGFRAETVVDNSINYRVRACEQQKIPYMLVLGDREVNDGTVSVRRHKSKAKRVLSQDDLVTELNEKVKTRELDTTVNQVESPFGDEIPAESTESEVY